MTMKTRTGITTAVALLVAVSIAGCKKEDKGSGVQKKEGTSSGSSGSGGPASSPVQPTLDQGWCGGHGVPESVCTRCNASLIPTFKQAGDWCDEHGLPESQCTICNPAVEAEWAKLNPSSAGQPSPRSQASPGTKLTFGPATSPVTPTLDEGWCGGHGVPESVCTRCNASLIPKFKESGDWCAEHGLPETQCTVCHPEVTAEWNKLNPSASKEPFGPASSPVAPTLDQGWCGGHGVPESVCTRCNASLIATFKEAGDWCAEHGLPETQCTVCHPAVEAEWAKLNPASKKSNKSGDAKDAATEPGKLRIERNARLLTGSNDPLCQVEDLRVRFIDPSIIDKAGIIVERVHRRTMSASIEVPAELEFDATRVTRITPRVSGNLLDVLAAVGDEVEMGDLLAVVDSPVLGEAKSEYIVLAQNLKLAEADRDRVRTIFGGIHRMLDVCTPEADPKTIREALAESPVGAAKSELLRAHAALLLARSEAARQATLLEKNLNSERDYQAAQSALAAAEADFVAIKEEIEFSVERDRLSTERAFAVAQSALESAERRLHILGLTEEQVAAIGNESHESLSRYELRSVATGHIVERNVSKGETVETNNELFVIAEPSQMWLMADLYERDLRLIRKGLPVVFTVDGMPGNSFAGTVSWISRQVDDRTRTVRVRADIPNEKGVLRANMFGNARIVIHDNSEVVAVPSQAVQTDGCCQLAFVRESNTVFQPRKIVMGANAHGYVEVLEGLEEGDVVVSAGSFLMKTEILKSNIGAGCCEVETGR